MRGRRTLDVSLSSRKEDKLHLNSQQIGQARHRFLLVLISFHPPHRRRPLLLLRDGGGGSSSNFEGVMKKRRGAGRLRLARPAKTSNAPLRRSPRNGANDSHRQRFSFRLQRRLRDAEVDARRERGGG